MKCIIDTPYIGQVGSGADEHGNDCGAASAGMIIKKVKGSVPSVDVLYNEVQPSGNSYLGADQLMSLMVRRGITSTWKAGLSIADLFWLLASGDMPIIALIRYGALKSIRPNSFTGSHFVVVIGIDLDYVYIHDPLNTPTSGECIAVPFNLFYEAWNTVGDGNPQGGAIVPDALPTQGLETIVVNSPNGLAVRSVPNTAGSKTTLLRYVSDQTRFTLYEVRDNWGRVSQTKQEWVCLDYTLSLS